MYRLPDGIWIMWAYFQGARDAQNARLSFSNSTCFQLTGDRLSRIILSFASTSHCFRQISKIVLTEWASPHWQGYTQVTSTILRSSVCGVHPTVTLSMLEVCQSLWHRLNLSDFSRIMGRSVALRSSQNRSPVVKSSQVDRKPHQLTSYRYWYICLRICGIDLRRRSKTCSESWGSSTKGVSNWDAPLTRWSTSLKDFVSVLKSSILQSRYNIMHTTWSLLGVPASGLALILPSPWMAWTSLALQWDVRWLLASTQPWCLLFSLGQLLFNNSVQQPWAPKRRQ